jgi:hypothetical protein
MEAEELEEGDVNPIQLDDEEALTFEMGFVNRISFAVADDPSQKLLIAHKKFLPEVAIIGKDGKILDLCGGKEARECEDLGVSYVEDCRDKKLSQNDDRKLNLNLGKLTGDKSSMIVFMVRALNVHTKFLKDDEYDRAMFRLISEDTNQTLDQKNIKSIPIPEIAAPEENDDGTIPEMPEVRYITGFLFNENGKWRYEQFVHSFTDDSHPNLVQELASFNNNCTEKANGRNE